MSKLVDLELDSTDTYRSSGAGPEPEEPSRKSWLLPVIVIFLLAGGGAAWYFLRPTSPPPPPRPIADQAPPPAPTVVEPVTQEVEAEQPIDLPDLNASDELLRALISELSSHPKLASWMVNEDLARRFVASMDNVAEGNIPKSHLGFMAPEGAFPVLDQGSGDLLVDPAGYERYDGAVAAFVSLDPEGTAKLYRNIKPLLQEAYQELGYPDADFDATLSRAIQRLLNTPVVEGPVALKQGVLSYEYAEPRLQKLAPIQRQLLRTGPKNSRRVKAKLRELATALGL